MEDRYIELKTVAHLIQLLLIELVNKTRPRCERYRTRSTASRENWVIYERKQQLYPISASMLGHCKGQQQQTSRAKRSAESNDN